MGIFIEQGKNIETFIENNEIISLNAHKDLDKGGDQIVESFWYWKDFSSYMKALALMVLILKESKDQ